MTSAYHRCLYDFAKNRDCPEKWFPESVVNSLNVFLAFGSLLRLTSVFDD